MASSSTKCRRPFSVVVCSAPTLFQEVPSGRARLYKGLFEYMRWDDGECMHVYNNTIAKKIKYENAQHRIPPVCK